MIQVLKSLRFLFLLALLCLPLAAQTSGPNQPGDSRNIKNGSVVPDEGYSDQPYVVIANDGTWLCVMTTSGQGFLRAPFSHSPAVRVK